MPEDFADPLSCEVIVQSETWSKSIEDPHEFCNRVINHALKSFEGPFGDIDVLLCDNQKMQELNNIWRKINKPTNVLSFNQIGNTSVLGSLALGFEICEFEAKSQNKEFKDHVSHLLVHGVLHLLGYDHVSESEAVEMESLEAEILAQIQISNPYQEDFLMEQQS